MTMLGNTKNEASFVDAARGQQRRGFWLRTMIQWHWISSAVCLVGMLLFAITGITLNHAGQLTAEPIVTIRTAEVPRQLLIELQQSKAEGTAPLPREVATWLGDQFSRSVGSRPAEWTADEIYVSMPGPGSDAWIAIDRVGGFVEYESTSRGWISYLNDLHKGRNTGAAWKWFLDVFAIATLVFCLTGLFLLHSYARQRQMTWPLITLGLIAPVLLAILMIH